jgi:hypothetical protein
MPQVPYGETVVVTVRLHKDVYEQLEQWARSVFNEEPDDFLQLFTNALMNDQALREQVGETYLGGA